MPSQIRVQGPRSDPQAPPSLLKHSLVLWPQKYMEQANTCTDLLSGMVRATVSTRVSTVSLWANITSANQMFQASKLRKAHSIRLF